LSDLCDARLNLDDPMGLQRLYLQEQFFVRPAGEASDRGRSGRQGDQVSAKRLEVGLKWEEGTAAFEGATLDCHDDIAKWTICKPLARYGAWGEPETPVRTFEDKWLGLHWRLTFDMSGGFPRGPPPGKRPLFGRGREHFVGWGFCFWVFENPILACVRHSSTSSNLLELREADSSNSNASASILLCRLRKAASEPTSALSP